MGVLEVAHSIFVRWRPLFRTDELYMEINHVIETFGQPFFQLLMVGFDCLAEQDGDANPVFTDNK